jgi:hypothetical protein
LGGSEEGLGFGEELKGELPETEIGGIDPEEPTKTSSKGESEVEKQT